MAQENGPDSLAAQLQLIKRTWLKVKKAEDSLTPALPHLQCVDGQIAALEAPYLEAPYRKWADVVNSIAPPRLFKNGNGTHPIMWTVE